MKVSNLRTKLLTKKFVALALAGTFALGGFALTNLPESIANAATKSTQNFDCPMEHPRSEKGYQITNEEMAKNMEECFGVSQQTILDYHNQGWKMQDLHKAASIAKISGKQIGDVLNAKTTTNTWKDVADSFGVTKEQMNEFRQELMSERIAKSTGMDKSILNQLVKEGYRPHDIMMANAFADKSGKDIKAVLSMKQINNHWKDVASQLGIDDKGYQECRDQINACFDGNKPFGKHHKFSKEERRDGHGPHNNMNWED